MKPNTLFFIYYSFHPIHPSARRLVKVWSESRFHWLTWLINLNFFSRGLLVLRMKYVFGNDTHPQISCRRNSGIYSKDRSQSLAKSEENLLARSFFTVNSNISSITRLQRIPVIDKKMFWVDSVERQERAYQLVIILWYCLNFRLLRYLISIFPSQIGFVKVAVVESSRFRKCRGIIIVINKDGLVGLTIWGEGRKQKCPYADVYSK